MAELGLSEALGEAGLRAIAEDAARIPLPAGSWIDPPEEGGVLGLLAGGIGLVRVDEERLIARL
ncbi:MAG: hypothetical protein GWO02_02515, partial [Gammaproteobacteria bacterium]|nr:hypothetical protein [Gammaproteobacteria bacterium]